MPRQRGVKLLDVSRLKSIMDQPHEKLDTVLCFCVECLGHPASNTYPDETGDSLDQENENGSES